VDWTVDLVDRAADLVDRVVDRVVEMGSYVPAE
jgi:hypothetical protein